MWKPMLAWRKSFDPESLSYPVLASPKIDGVRATVQEAILLSRKLKPIKNVHTSTLFSRKELEGSDGELAVGPLNVKQLFNATSGPVRRSDGKPDVTFHLFDKFCEPDTPFKERLEEACRLAIVYKLPIQVIEHHLIKSPGELLEFEASSLSKGYEGIMVRDPYGPYKQGRSTFNEGWLLKMKRFIDSEAEVIGVEELLHNGNVAMINELGKSHRSSHKQNMVPMNTLGALVVRDLKTGVEFNIGTGFDSQTRDELWKNPPIGQIVKFKYFPVGTLERPRHPVYLGFRDEDDL